MPPVTVIARIRALARKAENKRELLDLYEIIHEMLDNR